MGAGRPKITINWDLFDEMAIDLCTKAEIAQAMGCSPDTLERAIKREFKTNFADHWGSKITPTKRQLRRKQIELALSGHPGMLIWLGKQYLGQADQVFVDQSTDEAYERPASMKSED